MPPHTRRGMPYLVVRWYGGTVVQWYGWVVCPAWCHAYRMLIGACNPMLLPDSRPKVWIGKGGPTDTFPVQGYETARLFFFLAVVAAMNHCWPQAFFALKAY